MAARSLGHSEGIHNLEVQAEEVLLRLWRHGSCGTGQRQHSIEAQGLLYLGHDERLGNLVPESPGALAARSWGQKV